MRTETSGTEERIARRTRRAAVESMTVVPDAPGMFQVFSGETPVYTVDLVSGACTCPDAEYHSPPDGCKHLRRTEMEAGIREVPDLGHRTDAELMIEARERRERDEPEPEPITVEDAKPDRALADGGVVASEPQGESEENRHAPGCDHPECEGVDADGRPLLSFPCWNARQEASR